MKFLYENSKEFRRYLLYPNPWTIILMSPKHIRISLCNVFIETFQHRKINIPCIYACKTVIFIVSLTSFCTNRIDSLCFCIGNTLWKVILSFKLLVSKIDISHMMWSSIVLYYFIKRYIFILTFISKHHVWELKLQAIVNGQPHFSSLNHTLKNSSTSKELHGIKFREIGQGESSADQTSIQRGT